jgi:hypothetical protein
VIVLGRRTRPKNKSKVDLRELSLSLRAFVDEVHPEDLRFHVILGFIHRTFLRILDVLPIDLDSTLLDAVIEDYFQSISGKKHPNSLQMRIKGIPLQEIFSAFTQIVEHASTEQMQVMYLLGFCQGLLNRMMRKVGINYQVPPPF